MGLVYALVYLVAAWKWGDWRNWKLYYPTILFFIVGDLLYHYMFVDKYPMWKFVPYPMDEGRGTTSMHISFSIMAIKYPATVLIFLGKLPDQLMKRISRIVIWVGIYTLNEWITLTLGGIIHDHGWSLLWSIVFNIAMFTILLIHHLRPPWAWALSLLFILLLWKALQVPTDVIFR